MSRILLLLPSASYRAEDFIAAASAIGAEVVVASNYEQAMSAVMGDRALRVDLRDPERAARAIVGRAERTPLDAVVAVDDQGVEVAAIAAGELGLPHNPPDAAAATRDKARLRARLAAAAVPQPRFAVVGPDEDVAAAVAELGPPCVLKPVPLSGSRGVIRVDDPAAAPATAARIRRILAEADEEPSGPLLVESFVGGDEVALEGLLRGGRLEVLAIFDKPDPLEGPYFEETIYVTPSRLPPAALAAVEDVVARACAAVGLREGPIHAEARISDERAVLLEIAARSIGGLCSRALRFGAGISLEEVILRHAASLPLHDLTLQARASGVMMIPIPAAGRLMAVHGLEHARSVPGVVGVEITVRPDRPVVPLPEGDRYLGFLFARGERPEDVEESLRTAHRMLDIDIDIDADSTREAARHGG